MLNLLSENYVFIVAFCRMGINACLQQKKYEQKCSFVTLGWKRDLHTDEHFKQTEHRSP